MAWIYPQWLFGSAGINPTILATSSRPTFHRMRSSEPVHWSGMFEACFLTRYDDVVLAGRDPRLSSAGRTSRV